jgi:glucan phosphoethanolaminetransferase (alkaline phosphatase superfamily)
MDRTVVAGEAEGFGFGDAFLLLARVVLMAMVLMITNMLAFNRVDVLLTQGRLFPLLALGVLWIAAAIVMLFLLLERNAFLRLGWAILFAAAGASAFSFQQASGSEMSAFDALSLLDAWHEANRAASGHPEAFMSGLLIAVATLGAYLAPIAGKRLKGLVRIVTHLSGIGLICVISGIVVMKEGSGTQGLPKQFSQAAIGAVAGYKLFTAPARGRATVSWSPDRSRSVDRIVMLVDESVRADYLDFDGHTGFTPAISRIAKRLVNFGPAASGAICSNYANAILRFAAARGDLGSSINATTTLWQYAKAAGYRTVFIDAQAHAVGGGGLANFMTLTETRDIDQLYQLQASGDAADEELRMIIVRELEKGDRVFIYANKEGAHFPYDINYPASAARFHPTQTEQGSNTLESNVASYRNAISWNVDQFMDRFFAQADLTDLAMVYTSDHGQQLEPDNVTHCVSENPDPRMAYVPLFTFTSSEAWTARLRAGAHASRGRATHFQIAPTLLSFMGYGASDIARHFDESLTQGPAGSPRFTTRDVLGMFSKAVTWNAIDLSADFIERIEQPIAAAQ